MIPAVIDIEASGRGPGSYPIEVGVAMPGGGTHCFLIRPVPEWALWDYQAEAMHGINRKSLMKFGKTLREAAHELNGLLDGRTVYSDRLDDDGRLIETLFARAQIAPRFSLEAMATLLDGVPQQRWTNAKLRVIETVVQVRRQASSDARMIQDAYAVLMAANDIPPFGDRLSNESGYRALL